MKPLIYDIFQLHYSIITNKLYVTLENHHKSFMLYVCVINLLCYKSYFLLDEREGCTMEAARNEFDIKFHINFVHI